MESARYAAVYCDKKGDILFNNQSSGLLKLDIHTGKTSVLLRKSLDENEDNGNDSVWTGARVHQLLKIGYDNKNNVFLFDGEEVRSFNIGNTGNKIKSKYVMQTVSDEDAYRRDFNNGAFFFHENKAFFNDTKLQIRENTSDFSFKYNVVNLSGSRELIEINFSDFNEKIIEEDPGGDPAFDREEVT